ncbi:MAG: hypothetical protein AB8H47_22710 [Bacteroidia bacterium]
MKRTHFYQLLLGLGIMGMLFLSACGGDSSQDEAAIKAEVEQLEAATNNMEKITDEVEASKAEVEEAMKEIDAILDDNK